MLRVIFFIVVVSLSSCGDVTATKKDAAIDSPITTSTSCVLGQSKLGSCTL